MDTFDRFPAGQKRKEELAEKQESIDGSIALGPLGERWGVLDSSLDGQNASSYLSFYDSFKSVLPEGTESLRSYIETELASRKGVAIGIEFGGMGSKSFSEFTPGFFQESIGVSLVDHRSKLRSPNQVIKEDKARHHTVLEGDFLKDATYEKLQALLNGKPADLIIERIYGGKSLIPREPILLAKIFQRWYGMLNENGLMLIEVPSVVRTLTERWVEMIERDFPIIDVHAAPSLGTSLSLRLKKNAESPETLPVFDAREAKRVPRY